MRSELYKSLNKKTLPHHLATGGVLLANISNLCSHPASLKWRQVQQLCCWTLVTFWSDMPSKGEHATLGYVKMLDCHAPISPNKAR